MKSTHPAMLAALMLICAAAPVARAQVAPIFGGGAIAYQPEIGVVNTGVLNDVQATVSPDRKYVTLGMQPQSSNLIALHEFAFGQQTNQGFVGTPNLGKLPAGGRPGAINPPVRLGAGAGLVLNQQGMTRLIPESGK
jgi:hypothetical protein